MNSFSDSFDFIIGRNEEFLGRPTIIGLFKIVPTNINDKEPKQNKNLVKFRVKDIISGLYVDGSFDTKKDAMIAALSHEVCIYNDCSLRIFSIEDFAFKLCDQEKIIPPPPKSIKFNPSTDSISKDKYSAILKVEKNKDVSYFGIIKQHLNYLHKYCIIDLHFEDITDGLDTVDETINLFIEKMLKDNLSKSGDCISITRIL